MPNSPDIGAMIDALPIPPTGPPLPVVFVDHPAFTQAAIAAELIRRGASLRVHPVPASGNRPSDPADAARRAGACWVVEVTEYDAAQPAPDAAIQREAALRAMGLSIRYEKRVDGRTIRLERVWACATAPTG
jgi:hypothetical protein